MASEASGDGKVEDHVVEPSAGRTSVPSSAEVERRSRISPSWSSRARARGGAEHSVGDLAAIVRVSKVNPPGKVAPDGA